MENAKINRLEKRVAELEKEVAKLKGLDLLTDVQRSYISEYVDDEIVSVRKEKCTIYVKFSDNTEWTTQELFDHIDELFRLNIHELVEYFDYNKIYEEITEYDKFLKTWSRP